MRLLAMIHVGILTGLLAVAPVVAAVEEPHARVPVSLQAGFNTPLGTGGLTLGVETLTGWGIGAGIGFRDATPGTIHTLLGLNLRAPIIRRGAFDLGAVLWLSKGGRESEKHYPPAGAPRFIRWQWQPAYRLDAAASGRLRLGAWAIRLDAGVGYVLNRPRCEYFDALGGITLPEGDCADPLIPASENATSPWVRVTPFFDVAAEYDIAAVVSEQRSPVSPTGQSAPPGAPAAPIRDGRQSNAWLAPTALTLDGGQVRVTMYEGIAPELALGLLDPLQISAAFGLFGSVYAYRAELKLALVRRSRFRLALLAGGIGIHGSDFSEALWGGGGAGSVCLDEGCRSLASVAVLAGVLSDQSETGPTHRSRSALVSPNLILALGPRAKLVVEVHVGAEFESPIAIALLRFPFQHLGLELGVISDGKLAVPAGTISWLF